MAALCTGLGLIGHKAILNATKVKNSMIRISTLKMYKPNSPDEARRQKSLEIDLNPHTLTPCEQSLFYRFLDLIGDGKNICTVRKGSASRVVY